MPAEPTYTSQAAQGSGTGQSCAYCHGFANIPTLIRADDGRSYLNPDVEQVKRFHLAADPFGGADGTLAAGETQVFQLTVPAEEEGLGDLLVNELMALFTPNTVRNISVSFLNQTTNRLFQNAPVFNTLIFGDAFLNCCLPCCFLLQATTSLTMTVTNGEAIPVEVQVVARGKRFLPRDEEFRARMLAYWNMIPSYTYYLTLDEGEIVVPAGATVVTTMTVQGTGDFEVKWPRCEILGVGGGAAPAAGSILLSVADGVGREWQSDPMPMRRRHATALRSPSSSSGTRSFGTRSRTRLVSTRPFASPTPAVSTRSPSVRLAGAWIAFAPSSRRSAHCSFRSATTARPGRSTTPPRATPSPTPSTRPRRLPWRRQPRPRRHSSRFSRARSLASSPTPRPSRARTGPRAAAW
jgi:hypothetical protein